MTNLNTSTKRKRVYQWISKRSALIIALLLFTVAILLFWFITAGFSPDNERIIIAIAAISALLSAISAISTLLQAVETQKQRENLERPYITAYFDGSSSGAIYFVIENSGNSPALDVTFKFLPPPIDFAGRMLNEISLFANPISFLPNGKVIRQIVDASYKFFEGEKSLKYAITTKYNSIFGDSFSETVEHDLEYLRQTTLPSKTSDDYLKDISDELKELTHLIKKAQGSNSFVVESPDEYSSRMKSILKRRNQPKGRIEMIKQFFIRLVLKLIGGE